MLAAVDWPGSDTLAAGLPAAHISVMPPDKRVLVVVAVIFAALTILALLAWLQAALPWLFRS